MSVLRATVELVNSERVELPVAEHSPAASAAPSQLPAWLDEVAVFDLETTGVGVERDRIVTAHVGVLRHDGTVTRSRSWLANPGIDIPEQATAVHGITTERAQRNGRPAAHVVGEVVAELRELLARGVCVVAFNAPFDFTLLAHEARRYGILPISEPQPVLDPLVIDKAFDRYRKGKRTLTDVAAEYGVTFDLAHDAEADAVAAGRVALAVLTRYRELLPESSASLHGSQVEWAQSQAASLSEYFQRVGKLGSGEQLDGTWPVRRIR